MALDFKLQEVKAALNQTTAQWEAEMRCEPTLRNVSLAEGNAEIAMQEAQDEPGPAVSSRRVPHADAERVVDTSVCSS